MQIIGLDTSLNSTACTVYDKHSNFHYFSWRKDLEPNNVWNRSMPWCKMFNVEYQDYANFTAGEVTKMEDYFMLSSSVAAALDNVIDASLPCKVLIEGYSQKSRAGMDHDLVAYGTLVRLKMYSKYKSLNVIPPKSLKKFTAQLVYPNSGTGKKNIVYRNNAGIPGGSFDKFQMFEAVVDYAKKDPLSKWCVEYWSDVKDRSGVPKPADDVIDSFWLCQVGINNLV